MSETYWTEHPLLDLRSLACRCQHGYSTRVECVSDNAGTMRAVVGYGRYIGTMHS